MESEAPDSDDDSDVCGTGKVVIRRVVFLDQMENEINEIRAGDPVTLRVEYECALLRAVPTSVDFIIRDRVEVFYHDPECGEVRTA